MYASSGTLGGAGRPSAVGVENEPVAGSRVARARRQSRGVGAIEPNNVEPSAESSGKRNGWLMPGMGEPGPNGSLVVARVWIKACAFSPLLITEKSVSSSELTLIDVSAVPTGLGSRVNGALRSARVASWIGPTVSPHVKYRRKPSPVTSTEPVAVA